MGRQDDTELVAKPSRREAKRALRAHHKRRMKRRAVAIYASGPYGMDPKRAERLADHLQTCSCPCCGNPRRMEGDSVAERRAKAKGDPHNQG